MYRYSEQYFTKQQTTRPWMHWVAVVFCVALLAWMSFTWVRQGNLLPGDVQDIGAHVELPEDTYAVVVLFNEQYRDLAFELTSVPHIEIAVGANGSFRSAKDLLAQSARPAGWFFPNTAGVAYIRDGDAVRTKRIAKTTQGLEFAMPYTQPMQHPFLETASVGLRCDKSCLLEGSDVPVGAIDVSREGENVYISADATQKDALLTYARTSGKLFNPIEQTRRTQDGNRITELVPAQELTEVEAGNTTLIGGEQHTWQLQEIDDRVVLTNTEEGAKDLSTLPWTNQVCGKQPVQFYSPVSLPELADNSVSLVRTSRSWLLCVD